MSLNAFQSVEIRVGGGQVPWRSGTGYLGVNPQADG